MNGDGLPPSLNDKFAFPGMNCYGMTIADYFAAFALNAMLRHGAYVDEKEMARLAYVYANSMVSERNRPNENNNN